LVTATFAKEVPARSAPAIACLIRRARCDGWGNQSVRDRAMITPQSCERSREASSRLAADSNATLSVAANSFAGRTPGRQVRKLCRSPVITVPRSRRMDTEVPDGKRPNVRRPPAPGPHGTVYVGRQRRAVPLEQGSIRSELLLRPVTFAIQKTTPPKSTACSRRQ
jgi:hypothetical protein